jgi:hypothetical protein
MKKLTSVAALLAGVILASHTASAQNPNGFVPNDLYMGFENSGGGGSADYIVNLGQASGLIGFGSYTDLSGDFSLSDLTSSSLLGSNSGATLKAGVVGGNNSESPSSIFVTQLRTGNIGNPLVAGSSNPGTSDVFEDTTAASDLTQLNAPGAGTGILDSGKSWETYVEPTFAAGSFYGDTGLNPDSALGQSSVLYEDLWSTSSSSGVHAPFVYDGYFTVDFTGSSISASFTAVPEPSAYLISGAGGILLLLFRFRLSRRNA